MKTTAKILFLILFLVNTWPALGTHTALADDPEKPTNHLRTHEAWDSKEGGETIETAIEITLPFLDSGATCDNFDDYDQVCPYSGSTSPDVVYSYLALTDDFLRIDLCYSSYDTKVYVLDEDLNPIDCNDDFYSSLPCGQYISFLDNVPVEADRRYYIVIDGYGGDCGEYSLHVENDCFPPPCIYAVCPEDGIAENEPPLGDGYWDVFNSGCDSDDPVFQELLMPSGQDEFTFCGSTGYYSVAGEEYRDNDWFVMVASGDNIHLETESSHFMPTECDVMYLDGCNDVSVLPYQMGICDFGVIDIPTYPGEVIYLRVRPSMETRPPCAFHEDLYTIKIQGIGEAVVTTEPIPWGNLKSIFR